MSIIPRTQTGPKSECIRTAKKILLRNRSQKNASDTRYGITHFGKWFLCLVMARESYGYIETPFFLYWRGVNGESEAWRVRWPQIILPITPFFFGKGVCANEVWRSVRNGYVGVGIIELLRKSSRLNLDLRTGCADFDVCAYLGQDIIQIDSVHGRHCL